MTQNKIWSIIIIFLAPLTIILGAIYKIIIKEVDELFYLLLVAIPGALLASIKEVKSFLGPDKLQLKILKDEIKINHVISNQWGSYDYSIYKEIYTKKALQKIDDDYDLDKMLSEEEFKKWYEKYNQEYTELDIPLLIWNKNNIDLDVHDLEISTVPMKDFTNQRGDCINNHNNFKVEKLKRITSSIGLKYENYHLMEKKMKFIISFNDNLGRKYKKVFNIDTTLHNILYKY